MVYIGTDELNISDTRVNRDFLIRCTLDGTDSKTKLIPASRLLDIYDDPIDAYIAAITALEDKRQVTPIYEPKCFRLEFVKR